MKSKYLVACAALLASAAWAQSSQAATVFSDNFNSYAEQLNWVPPANWSVTSGSVDLIGETTTNSSYDFFPGNGGYVDLDGSTGQAGTLATLQSFAAGTYTLTFDLGGRVSPNPSLTTDITLGSFATAVTLDAGSGLDPYTFTFTTTGGNLVFSDAATPDQNQGNILDNVVLSTTPLPSTWTMLIAGFIGLGYFAFHGSKKGSAAIAAV
jgi:hypothetical protein